MQFTSTRWPFAASLIIPTYRREEPLVECLKSALAQDEESFEIVVVDQTENHTGTTAEFLRENAGGVRVVRHSPPSAVGARNRGLEEAKGEVLIFIDDDTTFEKDFVRHHIAAHESGADVVQGRVVEPGRGVSYRAQWMLPWLRVVGSNTYDQPGETNTITGCNFSLSRRAAEKVGRFDEKFRGVLIREDADYGARCHRAGLKMVFDPGACLIHHREKSGGVDAELEKNDRIFEPDVLRNELYFARKHFNTLVVWQYKKRILRRLRKAMTAELKMTERDLKDLLRAADKEAKRLIGP